MQSGSSGMQGSSSMVAPRDVDTADGVGPPEETGALVGATLGVGLVRSAAVPTLGCIESPVGAGNSAPLAAPVIVVAVPIVGVLDAPNVESGVPIAGVEVVASEPVEADPAVPSEVGAGNDAEAEGPIPNRAAKALNSIGACSPRPEAKASNAGSDAVRERGDVVMGVNVDVLVPATVDRVVVPVAADVVVVPIPPNAALESKENWACAAHGVAMNAIGASHPNIRFIPPPCDRLLWISTGAAHAWFRRGTGQTDYR